MRLLRAGEVAQRIGVSRTTLWRMERGGRFPNRRRVSENIVGWLESDVDEWIQGRQPLVNARAEAGDAATH